MEIELKENVLTIKMCKIKIEEREGSTQQEEEEFFFAINVNLDHHRSFVPCGRTLCW